MKISEVLNGVYDKNVGWRPASGAIKPVHIANGLFRNLLDQYFDLKNVVAFAVPWKKKNSPEVDPKRTFEFLVLGNSDPKFEVFRGPEHKLRFEKLREYTRGLLAADRAVFPQPDITSLTLTCRQMISGDKNDREVGRCVAEILRGKDGHGRLAELLIERLANEQECPDDPVSLLCWPLLNQQPIYQQKATKRISPYENKQCRDFFEQLERAADQLAEHERQHGNRIATLQRSVQFACLAVLAHAQALAATGKGKNRPPLFMTPTAAKGSRLALASEASLDNFYGEFESFLSEKLADRLTKGQPIKIQEGDDEEEHLELPAQRKDSVRKFLQTVLSEKGGELRPRELDDRMGFYELAVEKHGKDEWSLVVGETLTQCYLHEYSSGGPRPFLGGIGRKAGFIYPHFQGRSKEKRVSPSVAILDVLVRSCTPVDHAVPVHEFAAVLWDRFGVIFGGRPTADIDVLQGLGIEISATDLEENTRGLVDYLSDIGLARRYPDNISYIGKYSV